MASPSAQVSASSTDLDRLAHALDELIALKNALHVENSGLAESLQESHQKLEEAEQVTRELQERLLVEGQLRQDALKRIDDLVGWIEQLDPSFAAGQD
jgi:regulator of replication initiation timing